MLERQASAWGRTLHRRAAAPTRSWLTPAHSGCCEGGRASHELILRLLEEPGGCSSVIQPIMPSCYYDLICSLEQLSNPLPRWTPWAGKGVRAEGTANPLSLSLPVSVSLKGEGRMRLFPDRTHSLIALRSKKLKSHPHPLLGLPGSRLLPSGWGTGLEWFHFFSMGCSFPSAPVPWRSMLSHSLRALHKLFL